MSFYETSPSTAERLYESFAGDSSSGSSDGFNVNEEQEGRTDTPLILVKNLAHIPDSHELPEDIRFGELHARLTQQGRTPEELSALSQAYEYAKLCHTGQRRKNDENYIVHPVEVSTLLSSIPSIDMATLQAALLHDVLEDTDATEANLKQRFGEDVLRIVVGVTKLGKLEFSSKEDRQAENFRRMFLAMAEDTRVIMLKLADRLHNMRTLCHLKPEKQQKIATETLEIFAPLANRMGMGKIRAELEDLSLRYIQPERYAEIETELAQTQEERQSTIQQVIERIQRQLDAMGIEAKIYGRVKNYYSIYKKLATQSKGLQDIYDISAVRVIVPTESACYEVLGVIHNAFTPIPGRFKDYIAMPKSNLYQSLHTSVIGPSGKPLEVQIRTLEMHRIAEYGIAAHWKYKEAGGSAASTSDVDQKLSWLKQMLEMQDGAEDARDYVDSIKLDLFRDEVFVFTPKGKVVDLPKGSTPVDLAYRIHTEVGHSCIGALVNGKIVPLTHQLRNGDIIEILTGKKAAPRLDWIKFIQTQQAKTRIRQWYKRNLRQDYEAQGRQLLEAELTKAGVEEAIRNHRLLDIAKELNYSVIEDLFLALGYGEINLPRVLNRLRRDETVSQKTQSLKRPTHQEAAQNASLKPVLKPANKEVQGLKGMLYHLAKCCTPVPGDGITGVVTRSRGVMIHREDCSNLDHVNDERKMWVSWDGSTTSGGSASGTAHKSVQGSGLPTGTHSVRLEIQVIDRLGVFKDILAQIADTHTNLSQARVKVIGDGTAQIEVAIDTMNLEHLETVKRSIQKVSDVISIRRHVFRPGKGCGD